MPLSAGDRVYRASDSLFVPPLFGVVDFVAGTPPNVMRVNWESGGAQIFDSDDAAAEGLTLYAADASQAGVVGRTYKFHVGESAYRGSAHRSFLVASVRQVLMIAQLDPPQGAASAFWLIVPLSTLSLVPPPVIEPDEPEPEPEPQPEPPEPTPAEVASTVLQQLLALRAPDGSELPQVNYDAVGCPALLLKRTSLTSLDFLAVFEIEGLEVKRTTTEEERTAGILTLDPPAVRVRQRRGQTPGRVYRQLIDGCIRAVQSAATSTLGDTGGPGGLLMTSYRTSRAVRQALRKIGEEI